MTWTKPDFEEICLGMEVTAYANTDDHGDEFIPARSGDSPSSGNTSDDEST